MSVLLNFKRQYFYSEIVPIEDRKITWLCLGIDKDVTMKERHPETNSIGQADGIFLVSMDLGKKEVDIVAIPRDTMAMIERYNSNQQYVGSEKSQICLQYAYADGMERSCELTVDRVNDLFPDIRIDGYISINMQALEKINNVIGGVELTIEDEYVAHYMDNFVGSKVNMGDDIMLYLRARDKEVFGSAYIRMERMKEYILSAIPQVVTAIKENPFVITQLYQALDKNMVTNIEAKDILEIAAILVDIDMENVRFHTLEGEIILADDGYEAFYPDSVQLDVLREELAN